MTCMHPEFKDKFNVAVQARIAEGKRVKMHVGVPVFADFEEMKKLRREAQVFWDDDVVSCGYIGVRGGDGNEENSDGGAEEFVYCDAEEVVYGGAEEILCGGVDACIGRIQEEVSVVLRSFCLMVLRLVLRRS